MNKEPMTLNNHPAHAPLTTRRLHQMRDILSKASAQRDGGDIGYAMSDAVKLIDEAIAAFDAKPVAWTEKCEITNMQATGLYLRGFPNNSQGRDIALYTTPPAPVVPEALPCHVSLEPGMRFGKGVRTQTMLDALQRRAEYHAELESMTPEQRAEHDAGIAEFKSMLGAPATAVPDDGRDQFEEWFKFHYGNEHSIVKLHRANGGANYRDPHVDLAWIAWKDSRSAMLQGGKS